MSSKNTELVEANAAVLEVLLPRLQERREAIQKEVLKYGEAPAGIKEVFELCRGFERAYVSFVNESPVASKIKESFMGEKGLAGMVKKLPLEKVYELMNVKQITKQADGYQPHLMSPESGMRQLAAESLDFVASPVNQAVQAVYTLLLNAAREAAEKAGQFTEAALMGSLPMMVPDFKNVVMPAIVTALDEWKREAEKMAMMLVEMERTYVSAGFFRHTMYNRERKIKQQLMMAQQTQQQTGKAESKGVFGGKSFFPAFGASPQPAQQIPPPAPPPGTPGAPPAASTKSPTQAQQPNDGASDGSGEENPPADAPAPTQSSPGPSGGFNASEMTDPNSFLAGSFEKYNANDNGFLSMAAALRWQKRFFIFSEPQRMLFYFKSSEDVTKGSAPRGVVTLSECVVEDLDSSGNVRPPGPPPPSPNEKNNMIIRIRHKDPRQMTLKDHMALVLRADTYEQKMQWINRMRRASEPPPKKAPKEGEGDKQGAFSSFGGSLSNQAAYDDMAWTKDAEPLVDTHLGEGSSLFRADSVRDSDGRLLPAPQSLINPMRLADKLKKGLMGQAAAEARHDAIMEQFGSDMSIYTRMVCDTVVTTVPKAIVHCLIRKSEKNLLERLFTVIHHLTAPQLEALLKEEDGIVQSRKEARGALEDCKQAIFVVQQQMERRNMTNAADRPPSVNLPANCFAYAGMPELLTKEQKDYYDKLFSSEHAPEAMKAWTLPPPVRTLQGAVVAQGRGGPAPQGRPGAVPQGQAPTPGARGPPPPGGPPGRPPGPGGAAPPVPQRPALGQPGFASGPSIVRRAPPPPPGR